MSKASEQHALKQDEEDGSEEQDEDMDPLTVLQPEVARRVRKLRAMHDEYEAIHAEYKVERIAMERKFLARKEQLYAQRKAIVTGEQDVETTPEDNAVSEENVKGVTNFWFNVLDTHPGLSSLIAEEDIPLLEKLSDITVEYSEKFDSFTLSFHFDENEFISNKVLTKKYVVSPDLLEEQAPDLVECEASEVQWKAGKNLTVTEVQKKQKAKSGKNKGQVRVITKQLPKASFFQFFKSPLQGEDEEEEESAGKDEEEEDEGGPKKKFLPEEDYDVAHAIRTLAVPEAVLLFTGEKDLADLYGDDDYEEEGDEEEGEGDGEGDEDEEEQPAAGQKNKGGSKHKAAGGGPKPEQECKQN